jgi:hypothetical protein
MEFIPYTQALELKQLGFYEPCWAWYNIPDEDVRYCYSEGRSPITNIQEEWDAKIDGKPVENIGLPTFSQAFKFIREKYNLIGLVEGGYDNGKNIFTYVIWEEFKDIITDDYFETLEEAELNCLNELIKMLKENGK